MGCKAYWKVPGGLHEQIQVHARVGQPLDWRGEEEVPHRALEHCQHILPVGLFLDQLNVGRLPVQHRLQGRQCAHSVESLRWGKISCRETQPEP